jgi:hypothetical protein
MALKHPLTCWMKKHSPEQFSRLASLAGTSIPYLRHVMAGRRRLTIDMAIKLDRASVKVGGELLLADRLNPELKAYFKAIGI